MLRKFSEVNDVTGIPVDAIISPYITSDIAFFLEIAIMILLCVGRFRFARRKKIREHGFTMTIATGIHTITVLLIMIPSYFNYLDYNISHLSSPAVIITIIHIPVGAATLALGLYLAVRWAAKHSEDTCYSNSRIMRPLWAMWLVSLALGFIIYASLI